MSIERRVFPVPSTPYEGGTCTVIAGCGAPPFDGLRDAIPNVDTLTVARLADLGQVLRYRKDIAVIVSEPRLLDAAWHDVAGLVRSVSHTPMLIVASDQPDPNLWVDVLECGGFGVLIPPWYGDNARALFESARCRWLRHLQVSQARAENVASFRRRTG